MHSPQECTPQEAVRQALLSCVPLASKNLGTSPQGFSPQDILPSVTAHGQRLGLSGTRNTHTGASRAIQPTSEERSRQGHSFLGTSARPPRHSWALDAPSTNACPHINYVLSPLSSQDFRKHSLLFPGLYTFKGTSLDTKALNVQCSLGLKQ